MSTSSRQLALAVFAILLVMFLYLERGALAPFALAGVFAFILNPVVTALDKHFKLHKTLAIFIIYVLLFAAFGFLLSWIGGKLLTEARQITEGNTIDTTAQQAIDALPNWTLAGQDVGLKVAAQQLLESLRGGAASYQSRALPFFSGALREAISILVFFLAGFYLLRDGHKMRNYLLKMFPERHHDDFRTIWGRVNVILGNYLRGQLILIALMSVASFIVLETLGVRYALILAIMTGFLEIIPYVGPITAGGIATATAFLTGQNRFELDPGTLAIVIVVSYFVLRQLEDYFVIPHLYARLTKLHPIMVIFVVLAGGHLFGILGLILSVPVAASLKVVLEYLLEKG